MFKKITREPDLLKLYIEEAGRNTSRKTTSSILESFYKLAVNDEISKDKLILNNIERKLSDQYEFDNFSDKERRQISIDIYNNKLDTPQLMPYMKIMNDSVGDIYEYGLQLFNNRNGNSDWDAFSDFIVGTESKVNIFRYTLDVLFSNEQVNLQKIINAGIKFRPSIDKERNGDFKQTFDYDLESNGQEPSVPAQEFVKVEEEEAGAIEQIKNLENMLKSKNSIFLNIYTGKYKNSLIQLAEKIKESTNDVDAKKALADFDSAMNKISKLVKINYQDVKRNSKTSISDIDDEYNLIAPTDEHINDVFKATDSGLLSMPLLFKKYNDEHPEFAKLLLKTGMGAMMYKSLAKILGTALSSNKDRERGKPKLSFGELWHDSLNAAIDENVMDPELNAKYKKLANLALMNEDNSYKPGLRQLSDFIPPLSQAGHIQNAIDRYQENFGNIGQKEKDEIANNIMNNTHKIFKNGLVQPLMPHVIPKQNNRRLFDIYDFKNHSHDEADEIIRQEVRNRIDNAQDIYNKRLPKWSMLNDRAPVEALDEYQKESSINSLIKKYAKS